MATFADIDQHKQHAYVEVSLAELSGYVKWRREFTHPDGTLLDGMDVLDAMAVWNELHNVIKAGWVPSCPPAMLRTDGQFAHLIQDGCFLLGVPEHIFGFPCRW